MSERFTYHIVFRRDVFEKPKCPRSLIFMLLGGSPGDSSILDTLFGPFSWFCLRKQDFLNNGAHMVELVVESTRQAQPEWLLEADRPTMLEEIKPEQILAPAIHRN